MPTAPPPPPPSSSASAPAPRSAAAAAEVVRVRRAVASEALEPRASEYLALPRRVIRRAADVRDADTGALLFALRKGVATPAQMAGVPARCETSSNRGAAAGPVRREHLRPGDRTHGHNSIRHADGHVRSPKVASHVAGYTKRGDLSHWTRKHPAAARAVETLLRAMMGVYRRVAPAAYARQRRLVTLRYAGVPASSVQVNCNLRTGLHRDRFDIAGTMGVMLVAGDDAVAGMELVFPEYAVAADVRAGDVLVFDPGLWHGNAPARNAAPADFRRVSLVAYARVVRGPRAAGL